MTKEAKKEKCCSPGDMPAGCCKVEALVSIDERGQMVLPKDLRDKVGIRPGDKLAVVSIQKDNKVCCISLIKADTFSEMVKGMTLDQAFRLSPKDVAQKLGGLPEHKIHCSVLGDKALRAAINDYYRRHGMSDKVREETARIICQCMNVTDREIENAVLEGARTYLELQERTKLGTVCGQCKDEATRVLQENVQRHFGS